MLSILIPVYNYNIAPLAEALYKQAKEANIPFEIICFDDNSGKYLVENAEALNPLKYAQIIYSEINLGRIQTRQKLSELAIYDWLLFLDADVLPKSTKLIESYIDNFRLDYKLFCGGLMYQRKKPSNNVILRWKYGKKFEEVDSRERNLKPYQLFTSGNFLINKEVFKRINSMINKRAYGLDNYFASLLKQNNVKVLHINNEVYHLGLEKNISYLNKTEEAIETLLQHFHEQKLFVHDNKLLSTFLTFKYFKLNYLLNILFLIFSLLLKKNIISNNPNIFIFQFYKLLYICHKDLKT